jgi:hypothetical protein
VEEVIIKDEDKEKYLNDNHPCRSFDSLEFEVVCYHCNTIFKVGQYKVFIDEDEDEIICCPNAPECDGNALDWIPLG